MQELRKKLTAFAMVGLVATAIHYCVLILLVQHFGLSPTLSTTAGFLVSVVASYALNYSFTFNSDKPHLEAAGKFLTVASVGLMGNAAIMHFGTAVLVWPYLLVQVGATGVILFWNFFGNYLWSFRASAP